MDLILSIAAPMNAAIAFLFAMASLPCAHAAEVALKETLFGPGASLVGEIQPGDLKKLKSVFDLPTRHREFGWHGYEVFSLELNSRGGRLDEAMEIGRWVRKNKIGTAVLDRSECFSSCVYVLAAGVGKFVMPGDLWPGKVGIHRPYLAQIPNEGVQAAMRKAFVDSRTYFAEMNIPEQLADAMFSTSPREVEILSVEKLSTYRLKGLDIAWAEELELKAAAALGVTRQEYMERRKLFDEEVAGCQALPRDDAAKCIDRAAIRFRRK